MFDLLGFPGLALYLILGKTAVIPDSSLRGMLRTLVEIVSFGKVVKVTNVTSNGVSHRCVCPPVSPQSTHSFAPNSQQSNSLQPGVLRLGTTAAFFWSNDQNSSAPISSVSPSCTSWLCTICPWTLAVRIRLTTVPSASPLVRLTPRRLLPSLWDCSITWVCSGVIWRVAT